LSLSIAVITYLKLSGFPAGLILNFNALSLRAGLKRVDRPDLYAQKRAQRLGIPPLESETKENSS